MKKNCPFVVPEKSLNVGAEEREEKKHLSLSLSALTGILRRGRHASAGIGRALNNTFLSEKTTFK